ncbi:hypothetical protein GCM10027051_32730 [Niabella terrae]
MIRKVYYISVISILVVLYTINIDSAMDRQHLIILLSVALTSLLIYSTDRERDFRLKGNFFRPTIFAILGLCIVSFQVIIDYLLGNVSYNDKFLWADNTVVTKGVILSVIGLNSFLLGATIIKSKNVVSLEAKKTHNILETYRNTNIMKILALISLLVFFLTVNPLYLAGAYGRVEMGATATYAILFFTLLLTSVVIQNCINIKVENVVIGSFWKFIKYQGTWFSLMVAIYLISVLLSGDRGPLITVMLTFLTGFFYITKSKLRIIMALIMIGGAAIAITTLGAIRSIKDPSHSFLEKLEISLNGSNRYYRQESFLPPTLELANSVRTLNIAVSYIPDNHDYFYGRFQFTYVLASIPFISTFFPILFSDNSPKYAGSASLVTWIRQGDYPKSGDGTSVIGDFYCDFGVLGVIVGMFLFGLTMGKLDKQLYAKASGSLFLLIFMFVYVPIAIYISRSAFLFSLKSVVWIYLILRCNFLLQRQTVLRG